MSSVYVVRQSTIDSKSRSELTCVYVCMYVCMYSVYVGCLVMCAYNITLRSLARPLLFHYLARPRGRRDRCKINTFYTFLIYQPLGKIALNNFFRSLSSAE